MTSILTNMPSMVALQSLKAVNSNLEATQNQISTGLRISEASHNAAEYADRPHRHAAGLYRSGASVNSWMVTWTGIDTCERVASSAALATLSLQIASANSQSILLLFH
jgi:hypothetical protein